MFKREKRMHSFIIRAQEILADGKREESAKMVIQGLQYYSNKIIGAVQPYSKADATVGNCVEIPGRPGGKEKRLRIGSKSIKQNH